MNSLTPSLQLPVQLLLNGNRRRQRHKERPGTHQRRKETQWMRHLRRGRKERDDGDLWMRNLLNWNNKGHSWYRIRQFRDNNHSNRISFRCVSRTRGDFHVTPQRIPRLQIYNHEMGERRGFRWTTGEVINFCTAIIIPWLLTGEFSWPILLFLSEFETLVRG